jgi:thiamine biosynthesis lipoprotein
VLVSAGGDLLGRGDGPYGDGWLIAVRDSQGGEIDRIILHDEAVATSTVALRTWRRAGHTMHHLIDPSTGQPARTGLTSVTVIAHTATEADVFAKTALILGLDAGRRFLRKQGAQALFVLDRGGMIATDQWPGSTGR